MILRNRFSPLSKFCILLLLGILSINSAIAQVSNTKQPKNDLYNALDTIFIAFRGGETSATSTFTAFNIGNPVKRGLARTCPESLASIPGIQVQRTNYGGGSPYLRGLTGNQILSLVDGIRLNSGIFRFGPNQYINTIDGLAISDIQVALGTGSVQFGSDGIGGILNFTFRNAEFSDNSKFSLMKVGSITRVSAPSSELTQRIYIDASNHKNSLTIGLTYRSFGDVKPGGGLDLQIPTGYRELNGDLKYLRKDRLGLWTLAFQRNNQFDVPVFHKIKLEDFKINQMDIQNRQLLYLRRSLNWKSSNVLTLTAGLQQTNEARSLQKNNSVQLTKERDDLYNRFITAEFQKKLFDKVSWVSGYELYRDNVNSKRAQLDLNTGGEVVKRGLYPNNSIYLQHGLYTMAKAGFERLDINVGGRYQVIRTSISDPAIGNVVLNNNAFVYSAGMSAGIPFLKGEVWDAIRLYGNISTCFRAPNIDDQGTLGIVDFRYELPQYDLNPEYSLNKEYGLKYHSKKVAAQVSVYANKISGIIARIRKGSDSIAGYPVYIKQNVGTSEITGLEWYAKYKMNKQVTIQTGMSLTKGDNISGAEPMRRIPPANGLIRIEYLPVNGWCKNIFLQYIASAGQKRLAKADIQDNRIGANGTPGYVQFDMGAEFQFKRSTIIFLVQNLSNEIVKIHGSGINSPGRNASIALMF